MNIGGRLGIASSVDCARRRWCGAHAGTERVAEIGHVQRSLPLVRCGDVKLHIVIKGVIWGNEKFDISVSFQTITWMKESCYVAT